MTVDVDQELHVVYVTLNCYKSAGVASQGRNYITKVPPLSLSLLLLLRLPLPSLHPYSNSQNLTSTGLPIYFTMSAPIPASQLYLGQARATKSSNDCMAIYDKWAATYNDEVGDEAQNYVAPVLTAQAALKYKLATIPTNSVILDAGCGTGLVGAALAVTGASAGFDISKATMDGLDLSVPMLEIARKTGLYRDLEKADLNLPVAKPDNTYDIVVCVGTFTLGHVGPNPGLREFVRVSKNGGIVVATILEQIWVSGGFQKEVRKMKEERIVNVRSDGLIDYVKGHGDKAVLLVLEKVERA